MRQSPSTGSTSCPRPGGVRVTFAGSVIADSSASLRVEETGHGPVHYVPEKDVRLDLLRPTEHKTYCPFKGDCSYWTIEVEGGGAKRQSENAVWGYRAPYDEATGLAGHYAFYHEPRRCDRGAVSTGCRLMQNWVVKKPVAASRGGVVAAQNGVAARVGAEMLAAGGSAVDAVVATAFALAVREPWNSGLGGIGFMVVHPPGGGRAEIVDFGPIAPAGLDPAAFPLTGETITELFTWPRVEGDRNVHGPLSASRSRARCAAMRWRSSALAACHGATWSCRRWRWRAAGPAGRLVGDAEERQRRRGSAAL